jgi:uncharacterized SAM-binding protein YcdF (DUF218 family)
MAKHNQVIRRQGRRAGGSLRLLAVLVFGALAFLGIGFAFFVANLPAPATGPSAKADAIVALTGQGGRLGPAVTLLESGHGQRLLITGVNKLTSKGDLKKLLHGGDTFDCCADLGFAALDTRGNAEEAARWVRAHRFRSLIVVTADYHMPRSLVEFAAQMPGVQLLPYPVPAETPKAMNWDSAKRLSGEYVKYLASMVRVSLLGASRNA